MERVLYKERCGICVGSLLHPHATPTNMPISAPSAPLTLHTAMLARDGLVLKPVQGASSLNKPGTVTRGDREKSFYAEMFDTGHPISRHLPAYFGTEELTADDGESREYMKLEDVTKKVRLWVLAVFSRP